MAHDVLVDRKLTKPPYEQSFSEILLFLIISVLPSLNEYNPTLPLDQQEPKCMLVLDNACVHDNVAVAIVEATGVWFTSSPHTVQILIWWRMSFPSGVVYCETT